MNGWWVHRTWEQDGGVFLFAHIFWVIGSIVLHELAHGWAAIRQGDDTPIRLQRMTLNPLVHMGPWSLVLFAMVGIAWGVMPVDPSRFRSRRWGEFLVALAGPALNVALALVLLTALGLVERFGAPSAASAIDALAQGTAPERSQAVINLQTFLFVGAFFNIVLAVLNLLPLPPLDGSTILGELVPPLRQLFRQQYAPMIGLVGLWLLYRSGMSGALYRPFLLAGFTFKDWIAGG